MSKLKRKQRVDKLIYKAKNCEFFAHGPKKRKPLVKDSLTQILLKKCIGRRYGKFPDLLIFEIGK